MTADDIVPVTATARPVPLDEVLVRADLQQRHERKYLMTPGTFRTWLTGLDEPLDVLEIDGNRQFAYESRYFDTPDLLTYRHHRQGRRRRYKIRTRSYLESGDCCFEVKLSGRRDRTIKERFPHPVELRDHMTSSEWRLLLATLSEHDMPLPCGLRPTLRTTYRRTTLLARHRPVRITCDAGIVFDTEDRRVPGPDDRILVEVKTPREYDPVDRRLAHLGIRPESMSKYCLGMALLHPHLRSNPWRPLLKRHFGWAPPRGHEAEHS